MTTLFWMLLGFWVGAIPFAIWLGGLLLPIDIRHYGNGNPGATNAWRAGGWRLGLPVLLLDYLKGALPVGLAHFGGGFSGWPLVAIALAPIFGHAFSPLLRFRGGKALTVTFGVWTGLTLGAGPMIFGLALALGLFVQVVDGWTIVLGVAVFLAYLGLYGEEAYLLAIWGINGGLLLWKYRADLSTPPQLRPLARQSVRWLSDRISHLYVKRPSWL
jgi:acyl phosphate:glycerol-3-phosphate acyltransferase